MDIFGKRKKLIGYGLVSPLHIANFISYYYSNESLYHSVEIYLFDFWGDNIIHKRYIDFLKSKKIEIKLVESFSNKMENNESDNFDLIFVGQVNWRVVLTARNKVDKVILIDEGLSSYTSFFSKIKKNNGLKIFKHMASLMWVKIIMSFLGIKENKYKMLNSKNFNIDDSYRFGLLRYFKELSSFDNNEENISKVSNDTVIFCSQPWVELGNFSELDYVKYINSFKDKVESNGFDFVLKKHPAEKLVDYNKYNIDVLMDSRMIEEIIFSKSIKGIISKNSTSSFLIPALFETKSYLLDMNEIEKFGWPAKKIFKKHCVDVKELFGHIK